MRTQENLLAASRSSAHVVAQSDQLPEQQQIPYLLSIHLFQRLISTTYLAHQQYLIKTRRVPLKHSPKSVRQKKSSAYNTRIYDDTADNHRQPRDQCRLERSGRQQPISTNAAQILPQQIRLVSPEIQFQLRQRAPASQQTKQGQQQASSRFSSSLRHANTACLRA